MADGETQCVNGGEVNGDKEEISEMTSKDESQSKESEEAPPTSNTDADKSLHNEEQQKLLEQLSSTYSAAGVSMPLSLSSDGTLPNICPVSKDDTGIVSLNDDSTLQENSVNELMNILVIDEQDLTSSKLDLPEINVPDDISMLRTKPPNPSPNGEDPIDENSNEKAASDNG